jgi:hypothetical protein
VKSCDDKIVGGPGDDNTLEVQERAVSVTSATGYRTSWTTIEGEWFDAGDVQAFVRSSKARPQILECLQEVTCPGPTH